LAVVNGAPVEATYTNSKVMSRTQDTSTTGVVGLLNTATPASGSVVSNAQQAINETFDAVGMTGINDSGRNNYSSNEVVVDGDNRKEAIEKLDAEFNLTTGHAHSGAAGDGALISAGDLDNFNRYFGQYSNVSLTGAVGIDDDISSLMTGKFPGGGASASGVVTTAPLNRCEIYDEATGTYIEDAGGQRVYGRVTEASGVWTVTYFTNEAGVETSHSLSTANIKIFFREVFDQQTRQTLFESPAEFGTLDLTADVIDATSSQRGLVSATTQTFGGDKTFNGFLKLAAQLHLDSQTNAAATGSNATLATPTKSLLRVSNAGLVSIGGITAPSENQAFVLRNVTGADVTILDTDSGATSIITGTGSDFTLADQASCLMVYDLTSARWSMIGGGGGGSVGYQEVPSGTVDGVNDTFTLSNTPTDSDQIIVFVDGVARPESEWSLVTNTVVFGPSHIPVTDQTVHVWYLIPGAGGGGGGGGGGSAFDVEYRTISAGENTSKSLVLSGLPAVANRVLLDIIGGGAQEYSVDYSVSGTTLSWNGLGLDGILTTGDKLRITYTV
jgi:hypothetical protein